jgi:hypothetical protein
LQCDNPGNYLNSIAHRPAIENEMLNADNAKIMRLHANEQSMRNYVALMAQERRQRKRHAGTADKEIIQYRSEQRYFGHTTKISLKPREANQALFN